MTELCEHLQSEENAAPNTNGCEECLRTGDTWMHLRRCVHCGHVGCCDDSPNRHATKHYRTTRHPVIQSFEPGERWRWCFVDEVGIE